jgi:hypothetical protein
MRDQCKKKSIVHYLRHRGVPIVQQDKVFICSSPFSNDTSWSFAVYPKNDFYCWSTGKFGDIIDLVMYFEELNFPQALEYILTELTHIPDHDATRDFSSTSTVNNRHFDFNSYINYNRAEVEAIYAYAKGRGITDGFLPGFYSTCRYTADGVPIFDRHPALMFLHVDLNNNICGAKFRNIDSNDPRRFTARGDLGFYILDTQVPETYRKKRTYLVESETSANSLWTSLREYNTPALIVSMGGVGTVPKRFPDCCDVSEKLLIIDFDGNEELYQQRIKKYEHLKCKPIKLILPKGEDINSLYATGRMYLIEHLLNN